MKDEYLLLNKIIIKSINKLTEEEVVQLLKGRGELVYREKIKITNDDIKKIEIKQLEETLRQLTSKDSMYEYLKKLKKQTLKEIAESYHMKIITRDTKDQIIKKIIDVVLGVKLRKKVFEEIKL